ncbi:hypothetical protein [Arenibaculum pallidiluteum]|uniref:hypothetical protein n=1 Tax=Arenibaculum pallidiluteum TaxID=2812559 RepID=UPI001A96799F|nr:hypothetical protein [Arenibaculum pallidiluteum]
MKTLSTALIAAALLGAAPAVASDVASGQNLFHGSASLRSYAAQDRAAQAPAAAQQAAPVAQTKAAPVLVWGDRAVDPIYFSNPVAGVSAKAEADQDQIQLAGTDFLRPYAN